MATHIASGSAAASRIYNAALFVEASKVNSLTNMLTDSKPGGADANKLDGRVQTRPGAPFVRINDLAKEAGDTVTVDLYHQLRGLPVMGDRKIAGRVQSLSSSQQEIKIDQGRVAVESGGKMTKKRTKHDLVKLAKDMIKPYYSRLQDQINLCHLAGARGSHSDADWILPLDDHEEFAEIMVNDLVPPSVNNYMVGGDAAGFSTLDAADLFSLDAVENLRLYLDEKPFPLQPISYDGDKGSMEDPLFLLLVSPRQWHDFWVSTDGAEFRKLQADALQRSSTFAHPIFRGDCIKWRNIIVKKVSRPIRFEAGATVDFATASGGVTQQTAGVRIDRAVLLGAQALGIAYGLSGGKDSGHHFSIHTEDTDHNNVKEHSMAWMCGSKKLRFKGTDGVWNDHGVVTLDTAVSVPA